ncbi:toprim domain-containing protein [Dyadobacter sp. CY351]|uniref:toprim domain-containing protein n=1 Tax=Dyadobacter sp. CY351 TaxID=2909337 RepID=UPI001F16D6FC|nr:toprim domain-containing protein [Dyadobacter sp. CY351]MCF2516035.1 toprim domain-containing protein [Dyadobacter sp. CY351]
MKSPNKFNDEQLAKARNTPIADYLKSRNFEPVGLVGGELLYLSPLRNESTPSFSVNVNKNSYTDFGGTDDMRGDSIRLVRQIDKCSFIDAVKILTGSDFPTSNPFSFSGKYNSDDHQRKINITSAHGLRHKALIKYVTSRGILIEHAFRYLSEVHYEIEGKHYFAVGFKNDNSGFDLRNGLGFKGKTENGITTIDRGTRDISIFEGFFDFLSALRYFQKVQPSLTTIILNTTNNLKQVSPYIGEHSVVNCFLDNDNAGLRAVEKLNEQGFSVRNQSALLYPNHKDFNEFLIDTFNKKQ